jgi:isoamylase
VNTLRARQQRNFLATLLLSQGVPMLLGGDELSRSQRGNNNAWCQDSEISWFDWELDDEGRSLFEFVRRLIVLRRNHPVFRRNRFFAGSGVDLPDVWWMRPDGRKMTQRDWRNPNARAIGVFLNGDELNMTTQSGEKLEDESFLLLFNAHHEALTFRLPTRRFGARWKLELSTTEPELEEGARSLAAREEIWVDSRSIVVLRRAW